MKRKQNPNPIGNKYQKSFQQSGSSSSSQQINQRSDNLDVSPLTANYLKKLYEDGSLYSKVYSEKVIKMPDVYLNGLTIRRKEMIFYENDNNDKWNHLTATEDSYYDSEGKHIWTDIYDMHLTGEAKNGERVHLGLGKEVNTGDELDNRDIEDFANHHDVKNKTNFVSLGIRINNMEILNWYENQQSQQREEYANMYYQPRKDELDQWVDSCKQKLDKDSKDWLDSLLSYQIQITGKNDNTARELLPIAIESLKGKLNQEQIDYILFLQSEVIQLEKQLAKRQVQIVSPFKHKSWK